MFKVIPPSLQRHNYKLYDVINMQMTAYRRMTSSGDF